MRTIRDRIKKHKTEELVGDNKILYKYFVRSKDAFIEYIPTKSLRRIYHMFYDLFFK